MFVGDRQLVTRRREPKAVVLLVPLAVLWCVGTVGTLLAPRLVDELPLVLVLLTPRSAFLAAAALDVGPWILLPACTVRLSLGDPLHLLLGRRFGVEAGRLAGRVVPRSGVAGAQALVRRFGLLFVGLVPTGPVMLAAGASGVAVRPAIAANLLGTVARVVSVWWIAVQAPELAVLAGRTSSIAAPAMLIAGSLLSIRSWRDRRLEWGSRTHHPSRRRTLAIVHGGEDLAAA